MRKNSCLYSLILVMIGIVLANGAQILARATQVGDEEPIFDHQIGEEETLVVNKEVDGELMGKGIGVSGELAASSTYKTYASAKNWLTADQEDELVNCLTANFLVDLRLQGGVKGFLNLEADYQPNRVTEDLSATDRGADSGDDTKYIIKEFFMDTNIDHKVYFRLGKQVLKWGRGYFWNPTDLINLDKKDFLDLDKAREGSYGLKVHIPKGVRRNAYFFLSLEDDDPTTATVDAVSLAGKYEFLVGNTEMAFSAWKKKSYSPVYGFDISKRIFKMDFFGELAVAKVAEPKAVFDQQLQISREAGEWAPQLSIGFTKYFDHGNINDRISLTGEFYYNQAGYEENIFNKITDQGQKDEYINNFYEPYMNSKYYLAIFSSTKKFLNPDLTLNLNGISNLVDHSVTFASGLSYHPKLSDLYFDFELNKFWGAKYSEATFSGDSLSYMVKLKLLF